MMSGNIKIIVPCLNEGVALAENLRLILDSADSVAGPEYQCSLLVVDDGSTDGSYDSALSLAQELGDRLEILSFTQNFGKEAAIYAGLEYARDADAVVVIDADLGHPPELIPQMIDAWQSGHLVVEAVRSQSRRVGGLRGRLSRLFYRVMQFLAGIDLERESDFKLLDRSVVALYLRFPEKQRFFKGIIKWVNQPGKRIEYVPGSVDEGSSWSLRGLVQYGVGALTSFTALPLHLVSGLGLIVFLVSLGFLCTSLYQKFSGVAVDGFTTVIGLQALFASAIMFSLGIIGTYLGKIYEEVKARPAYIVNARKSRLRSGATQDRS